jgi:integrase
MARRSAPVAGIADLEALLRENYEFRRRRTWWRAEICFRKLQIAFPRGFPLRDSYGASSGYALARRRQGAADATIRNELVSLSASLVLAVRRGMIRERPPLAIPIIGDSNARREFFLDSEVDTLCSHLSLPLVQLVRFAHITGFRRGEALGLTWSRVDWRCGAVRLEGSDTKNGESRAWPFSRHPKLRRILGDQLEARQGEHVFHRNGKPIADFRWAWKMACRDAGLGRRFYHSLRRSAARNMVLSGMPTQIVIRLMGWKSEAMLRRYFDPDELTLADEVALYARNGGRRNGNEEEKEADHQLGGGEDGVGGHLR